MININMLRDSDDNAGFYAAACPSDPDGTWRGSVLHHSLDGGTSYTSLIAISTATTMGVTTNVLGNFSSGNIVDELNSVNVTLTSGSLASTTLSGLLSGVNLAVIGGEILAFRDAVQETDGSYTLRGFLRGRRGSEHAIASHGVGDRFILAESARLSRVPQSTSDIGATRSYKMPSVGKSLSGAAAKTFTNEGAGLKPYAPVHLGGGRDDSGNVIINWTRRNRISGEWRDGVDVPMSEATESYEVEIWSAGYSTLKRAITGLTSPTATYSVADQTTDFGSPQSTVHFKVYQMSAAVGRGYAATGSV